MAAMIQPVDVIENSGIRCAPRTKCIHCGEAGAILHEGLRDSLFGAPGRWSFRQCPGCGLGWIDPQPLAGEIWKLYRSYYTHESTNTAALNAYETRGIKRLIKQLLSMLIFWRSPLYKTDYFHLEGLKPGRLLEVGCGNGGFLRAAASRGWQAEGLDFDEGAVSQANAIPGVRALTGELAAAAYAPASFDAIVMNNVVEHLWNPSETLEKCRELLRPAGRLIMVTPNISSVGHRIFGRYWRGLEPPRHLFLFNSDSLKSLCRRVGFARVLIGTSSGGSGCRQMLQSSIECAAKAGVSSPLKSEAISRVSAMERVTTMLGGQSGEWLVVIAFV